MFPNFSSNLPAEVNFAKVFPVYHAKAKFEFLPTSFSVILEPVALSIVPKVEFNFEVIMYIINFVS